MMLSISHSHSPLFTACLSIISVPVDEGVKEIFSAMKRFEEICDRAKIKVMIRHRYCCSCGCLVCTPHPSTPSSLTLIPPFPFSVFTLYPPGCLNSQFPVDHLEKGWTELNAEAITYAFGPDFVGLHHVELHLNIK